MKKLTLALLLVLTMCQARFAEASPVVFAESIPLETDYGSSLTARAPQVWVNMINSASKTLDIGEFYIVSRPGSAMANVVDAIKAAAARGVRVRILIDSVFYYKMPETPNELKKVPGVELRIINISKLSGGVMHAKYFIVDGKDLYVGSQNFDWRSLEQIHELGVRLSIPEIAANFTDVFNSDWAISQTGAIPAPLPVAKHPITSANAVTVSYNGGSVAVYPAFSPASFTPGGLDSEIAELTSYIENARKSVKIQVMQFKAKGGWRVLFDLLTRVAGRGVKVQLIVADWTMRDSTAARDIKELAKVPNISIKVSSIAPYSQEQIEFARVEHCKYFTVDGEMAFVSTSNWERAYFYQSRNAAIILKGAAAAATAEDIFRVSWNSRFAKPVVTEAPVVPSAVK
ncbi:MAG: phospholipase D-like domain-containing protein [Elusimicrobiaceae bacterium]|nr:phospholipase D-like domain-containing protein [Elusimicrobiaceae bacterium]